MRDTAERQLRAYVDIQGMVISNTAVPVPPPGASLNPAHMTAAYQGDPTRGPIVNIRIRNVGQTPAHDVIHLAGGIVRERPLTSALPAWRDDFHVSQSHLGPGARTEKTLKVKLLTAAELMGIQNGTHALYVHGEVRYRDIFGNQRMNKYRVMHDNSAGPIGISTTLISCDEGNEAN
jgi:hypothetical protein